MNDEDRDHPVTGPAPHFAADALVAGQAVTYVDPLRRERHAVFRGIRHGKVYLDEDGHTIALALTGPFAASIQPTRAAPSSATRRGTRDVSTPDEDALADLTALVDGQAVTYVDPLRRKRPAVFRGIRHGKVYLDEDGQTVAFALTGPFAASISAT